MVGFSLQYELTYTNVLTMLDLAGIPLRAADRTAEHPLVIAGGSGCYNPEPMSPFFDAMIIGEGEEVIFEVIAAYERWQEELSIDNRQSSIDNSARRVLWEALARIPGVYVPHFYEVSYAADGTILSHPDPKYLLENVFRLRHGKDEAILQRMREDPEGVVQYNSN